MTERKPSPAEVTAFWNEHIGPSRREDGLLEERRAGSGYCTLVRRRSGTRSLAELLGGSSRRTVTEAWALVKYFEREAADDLGLNGL